MYAYKIRKDRLMKILKNVGFVVKAKAKDLKDKIELAYKTTFDHAAHKNCTDMWIEDDGFGNGNLICWDCLNRENSNA